MDRDLSDLNFAVDDDLQLTVAKGMGALAELIERLAEFHGAPLTRNAQLARMLTKALPEMNQETEEYRTLLKVLGCLYELECSAE